MSRIKEAQQNVDEYYSQIDWEPVIDRTWVESHLNVLHFNNSNQG